MLAERRLVPAPPPGPGGFLRNWMLRERGITQESLADAMGVSRFSVNQIVNGRRNVTAEMALRLAKVTSTTPGLWLNLQRELDLHLAWQKLSDTIDGLTVLRAPKADGDLFEDEPPSAGD